MKGGNSIYLDGKNGLVHRVCTQGGTIRCADGGEWAKCTICITDPCFERAGFLMPFLKLQHQGVRSLG